ncbi:putative dEHYDROGENASE [Mycobacterium kansasii]|uniref:Putative dEHYDROGENASE n=1 Tax=Mycobacterium kansasii TaxID=1768 RepID=A0A1V3WK78_MYCKA|nr:putative dEHYDROGENASE [Mycobacterium kansasii]
MIRGEGGFGESRVSGRSPRNSPTVSPTPGSPCPRVRIKR